MKRGAGGGDLQHMYHERIDTAPAGPDM